MPFETVNERSFGASSFKSCCMLKGIFGFDLRIFQKADLFERFFLHSAVVQLSGYQFPSDRREKQTVQRDQHLKEHGFVFPSK